ncbi:MAG: exodeoxyribonuclease V subunit gamma [Nanoarchaeota archaeon]|nr:exodeoxyribonuclease V subunit gamma [Nanoarchaeota archaeon]
MEDDLEYIKILKALNEIPFKVGKNLLIDFLTGDYKNKSVIKNRLDQMRNFGSMIWDREKIELEINDLVSNGMIEQCISDYNKFIKVFRLTIRGQNEIVKPTLLGKKLKNNLNFDASLVNTDDESGFLEHRDFLGDYNKEQKKAIISPSKKILCVAGAGSGKTSVLTKRIEFLVRKKGVNPKKILAITFTRKAKQEMENRLMGLGIHDVSIHTFNSFCEKILREHEKEIYGRQVRVLNYSDKILAVNIALSNIGTSFDEIIGDYFSKKQREFKSMNQLLANFVSDCFSVLEYFKITGQKEYDFSVNADDENRRNAQIVYRVFKFLTEYMGIQGLRDFTDQLTDAINFLEKKTDSVPVFEHILIDEYQDVNSMQVKLLKILNSENLFAVGDPRQAIFGWRGSDIKYILNFEKDFGKADVIFLTINYRSSKNIVELMNHAVKKFCLPDLMHCKTQNSEIKIFNFDSDDDEMNFIINNIINTYQPGHEIFVLARTNRQLIELSNLMKNKGISHIVKTDERKEQEENSDVTLATIHAIKGLQAKKVFVIGCNEQNFPCKAGDHPAIEMIKLNNYNKEEEEMRLFYVAISRAKEILYLSYVGKKPTYFINEDMMKMLKRG